MSELLHRIKIFVYRFREEAPHYLLLKPDQGLEAMWGPLQGALGFGDKLETAIRRRVEEDIGVIVPGRPLDLEMPGRWTIGDEEVVEWTFGILTEEELHPDRVADAWAAHRWARFDDAYQSLGLELDRAAVMRLHTKVLAA
ncbi:MAG: NUDIX domain-containing protein [Planctomycetota bacterium]